jgi:uncharacterized protein
MSTTESMPDTAPEAVLARLGQHALTPAATGAGRRRTGLVSSALIFCVRLYQLTLSPAKTFIFGPTSGCRFEPSCSAYAVEALRTRGALAGGWLALKRVCRCHPWGACGHDPVPGEEH